MKPFIYTNRSLLVKQTKLNISFIILCLNFEKNLFNKISLEKSLTRLLTHLVKKSLILKFNALLNSDENMKKALVRNAINRLIYLNSRNIIETKRVGLNIHSYSHLI